MKVYRTVTFLVSFAYFFAWYTPAQAITLNEEERLGREFLKYVRQHYQLVEDPMIVDYVYQVGHKLLDVMPPQPFNFNFYVVKASVYNAFAIPAGHVFINSGLLAAMESEGELAGILGHEIAHVACRHISQRIEKSKKINLATMAGMVAGIFLGAATGDPAAMQALTLGSAAAGQHAALSFSRQDETQADEMGIQSLVKAGYDPKSLQKVLGKIRSKQWFGSDQIPTYMMTHPAIDDRMAWVDNWMDSMSASPKKPGAANVQKKTRFKEINARLIALYEEPQTALKYFQTALSRAPGDTHLIYGYGLALDRAGDRSGAIEQLQKALIHYALDPNILGDLGRIYFAQGHYDKARNTLQGALSLAAGNPQSRFYLGRTNLASGQLNKAAENFEQLLASHPHYQDAYYYLGETYNKLKRMPEAHFNLGIYHFNKYDYDTARFHLMRARNKIADPDKQKTIEEHLKSIGRRLKEMDKAEK